MATLNKGKGKPIKFDDRLKKAPQWIKNAIKDFRAGKIQLTRVDTDYINYVYGVDLKPSNQSDELTLHRCQYNVDIKDDLSSSILEASQSKDCKGGRKFDGGKLQYGLLPPLALREVTRVLTYGAEKYEPDNWRRVPDGPRRYFDAAQRHLWAYKEGEISDPETGVNHLAHAICCIMFMLDLDESEYEE